MFYRWRNYSCLLNYAGQTHHIGEVWRPRVSSVPPCCTRDKRLSAVWPSEGSGERSERGNIETIEHGEGLWTTYEQGRTHPIRVVGWPAQVHLPLFELRLGALTLGCSIRTSRWGKELKMRLAQLGMKARYRPTAQLSSCPA